MDDFVRLLGIVNVLNTTYDLEKSIYEKSKSGGLVTFWPIWPVSCKSLIYWQLAIIDNSLSLLDCKKYTIKVVGKNINPNTDTYHVLLEGKGARFAESLELLERMMWMM